MKKTQVRTAAAAFAQAAAPVRHVRNLPNFVKDINSRLLQQDIFNKGTWDGNLFSAGTNQVLSDVGLFHHIGTKVLGSVHHGFERSLQCSTSGGEEMMTLKTP